MDTSKSESQLTQELTAARARITELEAAVAGYQQQEQTWTQTKILLEALLENLPDTVFFKDTNSRFIRINRAAASHFGLEDPTQAIGKSDFDFFTEEHARPAYEAEQEIIRTAQPLLNIEEKETWTDGREAWALTTKLPLYDQARQVIGTCGISRNITARRQAEEALAEEHRLLRTLIDNIPDSIFVKDSESRFLINNTAHLHCLGVTTQAEALGKTDFDIFPRELADQFYADEQKVLRLGRPLYNKEEHIVDQLTGNPRWLWTSKIPLFDAAGQVKGLVGISRDITELKQAEAEQERLQREIIEAQQRAIQELSTPIIPVMDHIVVMPLIGNIDTLRARDIMQKLLAGITENRAKVVILDITGVPLVDSGVAKHLNKTIQAAQLKGAQTIITGLSDSVAETIVDLGINWSGLEIYANLQTGLLAALNNQGLKLTPKR